METKTTAATGQSRGASSLRLAALAGFGATTLGAATLRLRRPRCPRGSGSFFVREDHGGEFVQFGPRGEQTGGKFYIRRPGRIASIRSTLADAVIADGKSVVIAI